MKIVLNPIKAEIFQQIFQNIKVFTDAITMQLSPTDGLYLQCMDSSHVSIMDFKIPATWFSVFDASKATTISLSANLFSKILSTRDRSQQIVLELEGEDVLHISFENMPSESSAAAVAVASTNSVFKKEFELPLIEIESDLLQIPTTEYEVEMAMPSAYFSSLISQMQLFSDDVDFKCSEQAIVMASISKESGSMRVVVDIERLDEFSINEGETIRVGYSLKYLHNICTFHKLSKEVRLNISPNMPMKIVYGVEGGWTIDFYLAPKIRDEDDE